MCSLRNVYEHNSIFRWAGTWWSNCTKIRFKDQEILPVGLPLHLMIGHTLNTEGSAETSSWPHSLWSWQASRVQDRLAFLPLFATWQPLQFWAAFRRAFVTMPRMNSSCVSGWNDTGISSFVAYRRQPYRLWSRTSTLAYHIFARLLTFIECPRKSWLGTGPVLCRDCNTIEFRFW